MTSARAAFSLFQDDNERYDVPLNGPQTTSNSSMNASSLSDDSDALSRLQQKLTAAIEHMECAQLEFFHVNRAFEARKKEERQHGQQQQRYDPQQQQGQVPWSVRVQLYCEFWQQFMTQLREALQGDQGGSYGNGDSNANEQSLEALGLLASNVWGETQASPQEVFKNGSIVLTPRHGAAVKQPEPKLKPTLKLKSKLKKRGTLLSKSIEQRPPVPATAPVSTIFNGIGPHLDASKLVAASIPTNGDPGTASTSKVTASSINGGPRKKAKTMKTKAGALGNSVPTNSEARTRITLPTKDVRVLSMRAPPGTAAVTPGPKPAGSEKVTPKRDLSTKPYRRSKPPNSAKASTRQSTSSTTIDSASTTMAASPLRKKKITTRLADRERVVPAPTATEAKRGGVDDDGDLDGDQAELQMVPVDSDFSEAIVRIKREVAAHHNTANGTTGAKRGKVRYKIYAHLRGRIEDQLGANEEWPNLAIPFPDQYLIFHPDEHPQLVRKHKKFWTNSISAYLEMVFYHPQAEDLTRLAQGKLQLRKRQRELLSEYIETFGIREFAQKLHENPEASFAFFFTKTNIRLDELSTEQLDVHLSHLREPWKSPTSQATQFSWWEALYVTAHGKQPDIQMSEAAKQQIANAHFRGELDFDEKWVWFANESPWKQMLDELRVEAMPTTTNVNNSDKVDGNVDDDDNDGHDFPQSPPRRKKIAGKVPLNREGSSTKASGSSSEAVERLRWFQQRLSDRAESSGSSTSTDDDGDKDDFIEQAGGRRIKLGKRLRTN